MKRSTKPDVKLSRSQKKRSKKLNRKTSSHKGQSHIDFADLERELAEELQRELQAENTQQSVDPDSETVGNSSVEEKPNAEQSAEAAFSQAKRTYPRKTQSSKPKRLSRGRYVSKAGSGDFLVVDLSSSSATELIANAPALEFKERLLKRHRRITSAEYLGLKHKLQVKGSLEKRK